MVVLPGVPYVSARVEPVFWKQVRRQGWNYKHYLGEPVLPVVASVFQPVPVSLVAVLSLGFFLGMRHATDADHVVAVSTIVSRERRIGSAAVIGGLWGIGHTLTILGVGAAILLFTVAIPPRLGLSMEFAVGLMLVFLGMFNLRGFWNQWKGNHAERHPHDHTIHGRTHVETSRPVVLMDGIFGRWRAYYWVRPLVVGLVHGMAGSAAVALLVLATVHDTHWAVAYLLLFGFGTIAGMMVITVAMASALRFATNRSSSVHRRLVTATGLLSVAFGLFIVYQMGFVHGLFTPHPSWIPQ